MPEFNREDLTEKKVTELRDIARETCGPGTWVAHAKKDELIEAILNETPPDRIEAEETHKSIFEPNLQGLPIKEAEDLSHEMLRLMRKAVARQTQPLRRRLRELERRIESLEGESPTPRPRSLSEEAMALDEDVETLVQEVTGCFLHFLDQKGLLRGGGSD